MKKIPTIIIALFALIALSACGTTSTQTYKMPIPTSPAQTAPIPVK